MSYYQPQHDQEVGNEGAEKTQKYFQITLTECMWALGDPPLKQTEGVGAQS